MIPDYLLPYFPSRGANLGEWRQYLRDEYLVNRDKVCRSCGMPMQVYHQHEGIYSRKDAQGLAQSQRILIHTPYNNVLLCADCNLGLSCKSPPSRERILCEHLEMYGVSVLDWCENLPFKVNPIQGLIDYYRKEYQNGL